MIYYTSKGFQVEVENASFAKGGEGTVHRVISPVQTPVQCAKIYLDTDPARSKIKKDKLEHMLKHNPYTNAPISVQQSAAWPSELLFDQRNFLVGFLMPLVEDSISAVEILNRNLSVDFFKFDIKDSKSYTTYLKIAYNIAQSLSEIQSYGDYVLVDFKLDNIRVLRNGHIAVIDIDSVQISKNGQVLHYGPVGSYEYRPPEAYINNISTSQTKIDPSWDNFSLAVSFFYLFLQAHPFGAIHKTKDGLDNIASLIEAGYYALGSKKNELNRTLVFDNFNLLGKEIQDLFYKCFELGYKYPKKRPNAANWRDILLKEIQATAGKDLSLGRHFLPIAPKPSKTAVQASHSAPGAALSGKNPQPNTTSTTATSPNAPPVRPINPVPKPATSPTHAPTPAPVFPSLLIHRFSITKHAYFASIEWQVDHAAILKLNGKLVQSSGALIVTLLPKIFTLEAIDLNGVFTSRSIVLQVLAIPTLNPVIPLGTPVALLKPTTLNQISFTLNPIVKLHFSSSIFRPPIPLSKVNSSYLNKNLTLISNILPLNQAFVALSRPVQIMTLVKTTKAKKTSPTKPLLRLVQNAAVFLGMLFSFLKL